MRRTLSLKRESLAPLSSDELAGVAGGATPLCPTEQATLCHLCNLTITRTTTVTDRFTEQTCTW